MDNDTLSPSNLMDHTSQIISAHVSNNTVAAEILPVLIRDVYLTLRNVASGLDDAVVSSISPTRIPAAEMPAVAAPLAPEIYRVFGTEAAPVPQETFFEDAVPASKPNVAPEASKPFVDPKKSVFPDYIICLVDGTHHKILKRHLTTKLKTTPEEYRARFGLPSDYPMVAPNYQMQMSEMAKKRGLGGANKGKKKKAGG